MPTVLVTGASGFIGAALCQHLDRERVGVVPIPAPVGDLSPASRCALLRAATADALQTRQIDVVFHLAGSGVPYVHGRPSLYHTWANEEIARALVDAVAMARWNGRVVFASTASVYGDTGSVPVKETARVAPISEYGASKAAAEQLLRLRIGAVCDLTIARIFHVFGPGQRKLVVYDAVSRIVAGGDPLTFEGNGEAIRDFVYIDDVIQALVHLGVTMLHGGAPPVINVCSGTPTRIRVLTAMLLRLVAGVDRPVDFAPERLPNPVNACVGDPSELANLGVRLPALSTERLADTVTWIRRSISDEASRRQPVPAHTTAGGRASPNL